MEPVQALDCGGDGGRGGGGGRLLLLLLLLGGRQEGVKRPVDHDDGSAGVPSATGGNFFTH